MHRVTEIKSEEDYRSALHLFVELCEMREKTIDDMKTLLLLSDLMEKYERSSCGDS
jgi:antitoxin component HigA of HigAB toxin-antitoxin module